MGAACEGTKECASYNCPSSKKCGRNAEEPIHPPVYSFVLIGLGIIISMSFRLPLRAGGWIRPSSDDLRCIWYETVFGLQRKTRGSVMELADMSQ